MEKRIITIIQILVLLGKGGRKMIRILEKATSIPDFTDDEIEELFEAFVDSVNELLKPQTILDALDAIKENGRAELADRIHRDLLKESQR